MTPSTPPPPGRNPHTQDAVLPIFCSLHMAIYNGPCPCPLLSHDTTLHGVRCTVRVICQPLTTAAFRPQGVHRR